MSYEYFSEMSQNKSSQLFFEIKEKISEFDDDLIVSCLANSILLKHKTFEGSWDRDIEISLEENGLFVVFFSGTRNFRERVIGFIENLAKNLDLFCTFEEE